MFHDRKRIFLLILLVAIVLRLPSLWMPVLDVDETQFAGFANAITDGGRPYIASVDTKHLISPLLCKEGIYETACRDFQNQNIGVGNWCGELASRIRKECDDYSCSPTKDIIWYTKGEAHDCEYMSGTD